MSELYLGYIARFVDNNTYVSKYEYRTYFKKVLGSKLFSASEDKLKDLAVHLYCAYVAGVQTRFSAFTLAQNLSTKELKDLVKQQETLEKKFGIYNLGGNVDSDLSSSAIHKMIKSRSLHTFKSVLAKLDEEQSPTFIKKQKAKERERTSKKSTKSSTKSSIKSPTKKKTSTKSKASKSYTVKELKEMARDLKIRGYTTMKKDELLEALGVK